MQQFDFTAWSLYTGPSNLKNILSSGSGPWVSGNWDGANDDTSAKEIKKDIDARIDLFINAFDQSMGHYKTYNRTFMVPEFFFRCKQGPYPYIKLEGNLYPFEYIQSKISAGLQKLIPKDNNYYNVVVGTVLTSNIVSMDSFLKSDAVKERMDDINEVLVDLGKQPPHLDINIAWLRKLIIPNPQISVDLAKINNTMIGYRSNPLCTVRNRGIYFHYNSSLMNEPETFVFEKQYESAIDLTMGKGDKNGLEHGNMVTEWMCNYPSYDITDGDKQKGAFATNARFQPEFIGEFDIGVEICLDHSLQRIRRTVDMTTANGASSDNFSIAKQLIPSAGMQIQDYAVSAGSGSPIFNADGFNLIYPSPGATTPVLDGKPGFHSGITCGVYAKSMQSVFTGKDGNTYYAHSQLAFTTPASSVGSFNNALGLNNTRAVTYEGTTDSPSNIITDSFTPKAIPMTGESDLFAAGTGELHYYEPVE